MNRVKCWGAACALLACAAIVACGGAKPQGPVAGRAAPPASVSAPLPSSAVPTKLPPGPTTEFTLGSFANRVPGRASQQAFLAWDTTSLKLVLRPAGADRVEVWDAAGSRRSVVHLGSATPPEIALSPDGKLLALGCSPTRVVEVASGVVVGEFEKPAPPSKPTPPKPKPRRAAKKAAAGKYKGGRGGGSMGARGLGGIGAGGGGRVGGLSAGASGGGGGLGALGSSGYVWARPPVRPCAVFVGDSDLVTWQAAELQRWDLKTQQLKASVKHATPPLAMAADAALVVTLDRTKARLLNSKTLRVERELPTTSSEVALRRDGAELALLSPSSVTFVDVNTLQPLPGLKLDAPQSAAYSPDGKQLAVLSGQDVRYVDVSTHRVLPAASLGFEAPVSALALLPERELLLTASGAQVDFWDAGTGALKHTWQLEQPISGLVTAPGGTSLFVRGGSKLAQYSLADLDVPRGIKTVVVGEAKGADALEISADGERLSVSGHGVLSLPALESQARGAYAHAAFSPTGEQLAVVDAREVRVIPLELSAPGTSIDPHLRNLSALEWSSRGLLVTAGESAVRVWEPRSGELLRSFTAHAGNIDQLAVSPDGLYLATSAGEEVRVWELETGYPRLHLTQHTADVTSLRFTHDSQRLLSAYADRTVEVTRIPAATPEPRPAELAAPGASASAICEAAYKEDQEAAHKADRPSGAGRGGALAAQLASLDDLILGSSGAGFGSLSGSRVEEVRVNEPKLQAEVSWSDLALGADFRCGLSSTGLVSCSNGSAPGVGRRATWGPQGLAVRGVRDAKQLVAGERFACARLGSGEVRCWGQNDDGQIGDASRGRARLESSRVLLPRAATHLAAGDSHACAVLQGGRVWCWGAGSHGQLGNGGRTGSELPVPVCGITDARRVALGSDFSCALVGNGSVECWGKLFIGGRQAFSAPLEVPRVARAKELVAGRQHACVRLARGRVQCWGAGGAGQLGIGREVDKSAAVKVDGLRGLIGTAKVARLFAGGDRSCVGLSDGRLACWGAGKGGELGDGRDQDSATPRLVVGISSATRLATRGDHSCALSAGNLSCWGKVATRVVNDPATGLVGGRPRVSGLGMYGSEPPKPAEVSVVPLTALVAADPTPSRAPGLLGLSQLSSTASGFCALFPTAAGGSELKCRGHDTALGVGAQWTSVPEVGSSAPRLAVSDGWSACVVTTAGRLYCREDSKPWRRIPEVSDARGLALGDRFTCALDATGSVWCWGANDTGQLGTGTREPQPRPQRAIGVSDAVKLAISRDRACVLRSGGELVCWGGDPDYGGPEAVPKPPALPRPAVGGTFVDLSASDDAICALRSDGSPECLGERGPRRRPPPHGLSRATQLSVSRRSSCALDPDGQVSCWGENDAGQLGVGRLSRDFAVPVPGVPRLKQIQFHGDRVCGLSLSGELWCWGDRRY